MKAGTRFRVVILRLASPYRVSLLPDPGRCLLGTRILFSNLSLDNVFRFADHHSAPGGEGFPSCEAASAGRSCSGFPSVPDGVLRGCASAEESLSALPLRKTTGLIVWSPEFLRRRLRDAHPW